MLLHRLSILCFSHGKQKNNHRHLEIHDFGHLDGIFNPLFDLCVEVDLDHLADSGAGWDYIHLPQPKNRMGLDEAGENSWVYHSQYSPQLGFLFVFASNFPDFQAFHQRSTDVIKQVPYVFY